MTNLFQLLVEVLAGVYLVGVEVQPLERGAELLVVVVDELLVVLRAELLVGAREDEVQQVGDRAAPLQRLQVHDLDVHLTSLRKKYQVRQDKLIYLLKVGFLWL